ncbi:MAG TPA: hypothetical protein VLV76_08185 [Candidatus Acidoferrum sp.]|nr:hypothetical protein [Candidatus Acidoferrum sp.]
MTLRPVALPLLAILLTPTRLAADEATGTRILGDAALHAALSDRTFYGYYEGGINWIEYYSPDGRSAYWDGCTHDGQWWTVADQVCFRYRGDAAGRDYCWMLYQLGSQYEFLIPAAPGSDAVRALTTDVRAGNSTHLPLDTDDCVSVDLRPPGRAQPH